jgi:hypothetical protein
MSAPDDETAETPFSIIQWKDSFVELPIFFHVMVMNKTIFAWVGSSDGDLRHLHASIPGSQQWVRFTFCWLK